MLWVLNKLIDAKYLKLCLVHGKPSLIIPIYYYLILGRGREFSHNTKTFLALDLVSFYSIHSHTSLLFLKLLF